MPAPGFAPLRDSLAIDSTKMVFLNPQILNLPTFSESEAARTSDPGATVHGEADGRGWIGIQGWLGAGAASPVVRLRKVGLTIQFDAQPPAGAELLPFDSDSPSAGLVWTSGGAERRQDLNAVVDVARRQLRLELPLDAASESDQHTYGDLVNGITSPGATLAIRASHHYLIHHPQPTPAPADGGRSGRHVIFPMSTRASLKSLTDPSVVKALGYGVPDANVSILAAMPQLNVVNASTPVLIAAAQPAFADQSVVATWRSSTRDVKRVVVGPERITPEYTDGVLTQSFSVPVTRPLDSDSFPDVPRSQNAGWAQLTGPGGHALFVKDSPRADVFFYLPTAFKLGFAQEPIAGAGSRLPMRAVLYRDEAAARPRVRVSLVAVPFIADEDRAAIRDYVMDDILGRTLPYVGLQPASGIGAHLIADFAASDGSGMPASIVFSAPEVAIDDRLVLQFEMDATDYSIFCEILRHGLTGRVEVTDGSAFQRDVPIHLDLADLASTALNLRTDIHPATDGEAASFAIVLANDVPYPVHLGPVRLYLVDRSPDLAALVFDAEEIDLAPTGISLGDAPPGSAQTLPFTPSTISTFNDAFVDAGAATVTDTDVEAWLDRVNRDGSVQRATAAIHLQPVIPTVDGVTVQVINLRVYGAGEDRPRLQQPMLPAGDTLELELSLSELMGRDGNRPVFDLEYDALYADGRLSLPQRIELPARDRTLPLAILAERADASFVVSSDGTSTSLDRPGALALIANLRAAGHTWTVTVAAPTQTPVPATPPSAAQASASSASPSGPAVSLVTDLIAAALAAGDLREVIVRLSIDVDGAPESTLVVDHDHPGQQSWRPTAGSIPPFRYRITYLRGDGSTRQESGTRADLLLYLDVPTA